MKTILAVIIATIIAISSTYYFLSTKKMNLTIFSTENQKQVYTNNSYTLSSKEYATMGKQLFSAFQCASWAYYINDNQDEAQRLFKYGYEQGQKFLSALNAQKIKEEDMSSQVPIGVILFLQGPSEEFILGRIHGFAEQEALKDVLNNDNNLNDDEMKRIIASNKYRNGNCELLGK